MMIPVQIMDLRRTMGEGSVVLLQEKDQGEDGRILPIFIGRHEANAIDIGLQKIEHPRPMTHDLLKEMMDFLEMFELGVISVDITEMRERTYFAEIILGREKTKNLPEDPNPLVPTGEDVYISHEGIEYTVEARISSRPSDAIALAVRLDCDIVVEEEIMSEAGIRMSEMMKAEEGEEMDYEDEDSDEILDRFKNFIEEVRPQDFDDPSGDNPNF